MTEAHKFQELIYTVPPALPKVQPRSRWSDIACAIIGGGLVRRKRGAVPIAACRWRWRTMAAPEGLVVRAAA